MNTAQTHAAATQHTAAHNEGGEGFNPHHVAHAAAVDAALEARMADILANMDAYRARWMAAVAKYSTAKGVACKDLPKIEREAGITQNEIACAKARMQAHAA